MSNKTNYDEDARSDARDTVRNFAGEIVEQIREDGAASGDLNNDYSGGDSYHHENHVDREYSLLEAATLLDQLSSHEESDSGLWQGMGPRNAVSAQAAYTYGNAVYYYWRGLIKEINELVVDVDDEDRREAFARLWIFANCQHYSLMTPHQEQAGEILSSAMDRLADDQDAREFLVLADYWDDRQEHLTDVQELRRLVGMAQEKQADEEESADDDPE